MSKKPVTSAPEARRKGTWRLGWVGVILSIVYLAVIAFFQHEKLGNVLELNLNEFGDFLAGALGPLGIFWLILGFFQQGSELRNSIRALDLQTQELQDSVEQQRKLATATNRQLELQQEQFAQTTKELTKSRTPKFIVSYLGYEEEEVKNVMFGRAGIDQAKDSPERPLKHKLAFANVGGTACEVDIFLGYGSLEPDEGSVVVWPQFETIYRHVWLFASDTHGDAIQLDIHFTDAVGNRGILERSFVRVSHGEYPRFEIQGSIKKSPGAGPGGELTMTGR